MEQETKEKSELDLRSALGALLFYFGEPLSFKKIEKATKIKPEEIRKVLKELKPELNKLGLTLIERKEKVQIATLPEHSELIKQLIDFKQEDTLGQGSLETLAIIAYLKKATKDEIELIRGVNCSRTLRNLSIKGLIKELEIEGVKKYQPTLKFLRSTGVEKLEDLPDFDKLYNDKRIREILN